MACHSRMVVTIGRKRRMVPSRKSPRYAMRSMRDARRMFQYLRTERTVRHAAGGGAASTRLMTDLLARVALLENAGDHLVERRILDTHVHHGVAVEDDAEHFRHTAAIDFQVGGRSFATGHFTEPFQVRGRGLA